MKAECAQIPRTQSRPDGLGPFVFARDTFAYPNELYWEYRFDPATQKTTTVWQQPLPAYAHRCFVLVRTARQFFYHARFEASQPTATDSHYKALIRQVVSRPPWRPSPPHTRIIVPGFEGLRSFSLSQAPILKATCGGAWQSYFLRSHWRIVFPYSRPHQQHLAQRLIQACETQVLPVVHLIRFPQLTINHGIILFAGQETEATLEFTAYDPNLPERPVILSYDRAARTFFFPGNHYWSGGRVDVMEIYCRRFC